MKPTSSRLTPRVDTRYSPARLAAAQSSVRAMWKMCLGSPSIKAAGGHVPSVRAGERHLSVAVQVGSPTVRGTGRHLSDRRDNCEILPDPEDRSGEFRVLQPVQLVLKTFG